MTEPGATAQQAFEQALQSAEAALQRALDTLVSTSAADLPRLAEDLVLALRQCAQAAQPMASPSTALQLRMQALGAGLTQFQSALVRSQSSVAQQLRVLLPSDELATYGRGVGAYVPGRSAASFTSLNA